MVTNQIAGGGCHCKDVEVGSYDNQVSMLMPFEQEHRDDHWVCIDTCVATEIGWLWHQGVKTINSCCGHNKYRAWVIVDPKHHIKMIGLGYDFEIAPSGAKAYFMKTGTK